MELALGGDALALKLCLDRLMAPVRERAVEVALPPWRSAADLAPVMGALTAAAGRITPGEGAQLAGMVETAMRAIEASDFEQRLAGIDSQYGSGPRGRLQTRPGRRARRRQGSRGLPAPRIDTGQSRIDNSTVARAAIVKRRAR